MLQSGAVFPTVRDMQIRVEKKLAARIKKCKQKEPYWKSHNQIANAAIAKGLKDVESRCEVES